jgi:predicted nuclease of predicted toxin-antitoxin system
MNAADTAIWEYAKQQNLVLVSKDRDFVELSARFGAPPNVVLIAMGNAGTAEVERALRAATENLESLVASVTIDCLVIGT